jgi:hypothetical protein
LIGSSGGALRAGLAAFSALGGPGIFTTSPFQNPRFSRMIRDFKKHPIVLFQISVRLGCEIPRCREQRVRLSAFVLESDPHC